jgi:hypothetical protein
MHSRPHTTHTTLEIRITSPDGEVQDHHRVSGLVQRVLVESLVADLVDNLVDSLADLPAASLFRYLSPKY